MSLLLLFVSFGFAIYGAWVFFAGYTGGVKPNTDIAAAMAGLAFAVIPYMIAKALAEMVAIRQRHLQLEQTAQFNYMMADQIEMAQEASRQQVEKDTLAQQQAAAMQQQAATAAAPAPKKSAPKSPPKKKSAPKAPPAPKADNT